MIDPTPASLLGAKHSASFYGTDQLLGAGKKDAQKVAGEFESIFYRMLFKAVREASMGDPLFDTSQMQTVKEMQHDELANVLGSEGHLGVVKLVTDYVEKVQGENVVQPGKFSQFMGLLKDQQRVSQV